MFALSKISLKGFRCYSDASFSFSNNNKIIFCGKNASGKTSLVEAIHYLAFAKSFKTSKDEDLIANLNNPTSTMYIKGEFNDSTVTEIGYDGANKLIKTNGKKVKSISSMVGYFMIGLFCPEDLLLVKGDPKNRRRYIDLSLCQVDKEYMKALQVNKSALKERNEYLKTLDCDVSKLNQTYLDAITKTYIDSCEIIEKKRAKFIEEINAISKQVVSQISDEKDNINLSFISNVNVDNFWITYKDKIMHDLYAKTTTWGPQRDDILIEINNQNAAASASQGQIRTACLSLKLAVVEYYKKATKNIIIILDDVFSELDENRQNKILDYFNDNYQVFITTTNINLLTKNALKNSEIIEISRGE